MSHYQSASWGIHQLEGSEQDKKNKWLQSPTQYSYKRRQNKAKKKKDCSVSRTELEVGKVDRKATSEEPGLLRMGKRTINNNCSLNAHTVEGSVGKEELKNQLQRTHSHKDKWYNRPCLWDYLFYSIYIIHYVILLFKSQFKGLLPLSYSSHQSSNISQPCWEWTIKSSFS